MKTVAMAFAGLAFGTSAATAQPSPTAPALFEIVDVDRETVPAGTPEAFEAAFDENTRTEGRWYESVREIEEQHFTFVPLTLIPLSDGRTALISTGANSCTGQACLGRNAVHYLRRSPSRYAVDGEWLDVGSTGTVGNPAARWGKTDDIADDPVLYTEGGGVWQGYACTYASLTQLTPSGPVEIAHFLVHSSNGGAVESEAETITLDGVIVAAEKGRSFSVAYSGTHTYTERYVLGDDGRYQPVEPTQTPSCG